MGGWDRPSAREAEAGGREIDPGRRASCGGGAIVVASLARLRGREESRVTCPPPTGRPAPLSSFAPLMRTGGRDNSPPRAAAAAAAKAGGSAHGGGRAIGHRRASGRLKDRRGGSSAAGVPSLRRPTKRAAVQVRRSPASDGPMVLGNGPGCLSESDRPPTELTRLGDRRASRGLA
jgi:hypothetical protein